MIAQKDVDEQIEEVEEVERDRHEGIVDRGGGC